MSVGDLVTQEVFHNSPEGLVIRKIVGVVKQISFYEEVTYMKGGKAYPIPTKKVQFLVYWTDGIISWEPREYLRKLS